MKRNPLLIFTLLLGLLFVAPHQYKAHAQDADMNAGETVTDNIILPISATSQQADTVQNGFKIWQFNMQNNGQTDITNPTITLKSGYDSSIFDSVPSFPYIYNLPTLTPGQDYSTDWLMPTDAADFNIIQPNYSTAVSFTTGYDSTRTVSPEMIPVGGTQQTVTITLTPVDSQYASELSGLGILLSTNVPDVTVVSTTYPANLDQGEQVSSSSESGDLTDWTLNNSQLNKQYTFTVILNVPNNTGQPFAFRPEVHFWGSWKTAFQEAVGPSVTITDSSLDGNTPGIGAVTYAIAETDRTWSYGQQLQRDVIYQGTQPAGPMDVSILIKPGSNQPAPINPKSQGVIPVAILSTDTFDATTVDPKTITFGKMGMGPKVSSTQNSLEDVNKDGMTDMVLHFPNELECGVTTATLNGQTKDGQQINGSASVNTVGCN